MENFTVHNPEKCAAEKVAGVCVCGSDCVNLLLDVRLTSKLRDQSVNDIDRWFVLSEISDKRLKLLMWSKTETLICCY